jgi:precorrin-6Y C5,15-methyltransferase (decarboxylating)
MPPEEALVVPAPSAFNLAAARLGWPLESVVTLSLHGRPVELLRPHLHPGARILALTSDAEGPAAVAALLREGFAATRMTVLEALGGLRERIRATTARDFALADIAPLNLLALEVVATPGVRILHARRRGCRTRISSMTASSPSAKSVPSRSRHWRRAGARCSGISEPARAPSASSGCWPTRRCAPSPIEARAERAARIRRNALALGVPGLSVVEGEAPAALDGLEPPDAIFLGGGAGDALDAALLALKPGGRCVANAVTLETEALLLARRAALGGEMIRLAVSRAEPVGGLTGWRAAMPVTQWIWDKPA